jgi:hypothetical protein
VTSGRSIFARALNRIREIQGLKAAIAWRDARFRETSEA